MVEYLMSFLMNSAQGRARRDASGAFVLEFGRPFRVIFIGALLLWVAIFADLLVEAPPTQDDMPAMLILAGFAVATGAMLLTIYRHAITLTDYGIHRRNPWMRDFDASWGQIQQVTYSRVGKEFVINTAAGRIRVPRCLNGLATFREELERRVPLPCWSAAQQELEGVAKGLARM